MAGEWRVMSRSGEEEKYERSAEGDGDGEGCKHTQRERLLVHVLCSCGVHLNNPSAFRTLALSHVIVDGQVAFL